MHNPYNFKDCPPRHQTGSLKWDRYPADVLPLWVADMDIETAPEIIEALEQTIRYQKNEKSALEKENALFATSEDEIEQLASQITDNEKKLSDYQSRWEQEVELVDEAFKKGMLKLKDGKTVKIDEKTAKFLNNAMKQLNPGNRKKMETEAMKDKKSFEAMVDFAKAAA